MLKIIRILLIGSAFVAPLVYTKAFVYPGTFPRAVFWFAVVSLISILWLVHFFKSREIRFKGNWLTVSIVGYIGLLLLSGIVGGHFENSFFSSFERMTGISTFIYAFLWFFIASSVLGPKDWINVFRAFLFSGVVLAVVSFGGKFGFDLASLRDMGGSLFGNTTFAGIYYFFAVFFGVFLLIKDSSLKWRTAYVASMLFILSVPELMNFDIWMGSYGFMELIRDPFILLGEARSSTLSIWFGLALSAGFYFIHRLRSIPFKTKSIIFGSIILVIFTIMIGFVSSVVAGTGFGHEFLKSQEDIIRPIIWEQGAEAFQNKPFLGYGPNNFNYAYQDTFNPEVAFLDNSNWFDKVHNAGLAVLIETGILGVLMVVIVSGLVGWYVFRNYIRTHNFVMPVIGLAFLMHFVQIQTAFNTNVSIFLVATLLAYVVGNSSKEVKYSLSQSLRTVLLAFGLVAIIGLFVATAVIPAVQSNKIITAMRSGSLEERTEMYNMLHSLYGYRTKPILFVSEKYVNALFENIYDFDSPEAREKVNSEFSALFGLYEAHMDKSGDDFRFLINYVNMIHISRLFGGDRLDKAGELLEEAERLSVNYPQLYWLKALQARYVGDHETAEVEIEKVIKLYENTDFTISDDMLRKVAGTSISIQDFLKQTRGAGNGVYYHIRDL